MKTISRLHFITTNAAAAEKACAGGVNWVQLRLKNISYNEYRSVALAVQAVCKRVRATFIINDNVALAKEIGADGVHIGKEDMNPDETRRLLGDNFIIGCTANTIEDVKHLSGKPIDYIGLGPFRFTNTKEKLSPILGIEGYRSVFANLNAERVVIPPIVGIGGIMHEDVTTLLDTGLHGVAVSGAIGNVQDTTAAAQQFTKLLSPAMPA